MIKSKKIIIVTHFLLYGAAHALRDYLNIKKVDDVILIALPFHSQREVIVEQYQKGSPISKLKKKRQQSVEIFNYIYDFVNVLQVIFKKKDKYDLFVGVNNLNCLAGILLRKLNKVNKVIYYSIDFVPIRFSNKILNYIYHEIEIFAVKNADEVWNVSPRIALGRKEFLNIQVSPKQIVVPIGVWNDKVKKVDFSKVKKHQTVFIGHLLEKQGLQVVFEAIPDIITKVKDFKLLIIGDGEYKSTLRGLAKKINIEKYIEFYGWIRDREKVDDILSQNSLGFAMYEPEKEKLHNFTYYADPTKIKDYLSSGLPVILTNVSHNALDLEKKGCAVVVEYNSKEVARTVKNILSDNGKLIKYRVNALTVAREFDWNNIFSNLII